MENSTTEKQRFTFGLPAVTSESAMLVALQTERESLAKQMALIDFKQQLLCSGNGTKMQASSQPDFRGLPHEVSECALDALIKGFSKFEDVINLISVF